MNTNYAYAIGYYDGRAEGVYNNPYEDKEMAHNYKIGYDRGVADYCHYEECLEINLVDHDEECGK
jgi:hypothetical protein